MPRSSPQAVGRVVAVFEVEIDRARPPAWCRLVTSIPGREGTFARAYTLDAGTISESAYEDLSSTLLREVLQCFTVAAGGVQGELRPR